MTTGVGKPACLALRQRVILEVPGNLSFRLTRRRWEASDIGIAPDRDMATLKLILNGTRRISLLRIGIRHFQAGFCLILLYSSSSRSSRLQAASKLFAPILRATTASAIARRLLIRAAIIRSI